MTRVTNTIKPIAAVLFGLGIAVVALELLPRMLPGLLPAKVRAVQRIYDARSSWESMMRGDRELGFTLRPDLDLRFPSEGREIHITTREFDSLGFGFRDLGTSAPYDALALGDSFTFCDDAPAEACWVRRLADKTELSIATLGVNGYSNLAEARLLRKLAPSVRAKLVLVGFFPNDFKDNLHFARWAESGSNDDYWTWMRRKRRSDLSDRLARYSILYRLFDAARRYGKRRTCEYHEGGLDYVWRADAWWRQVVNNPGKTPGFELMEKAFADMKSSASRMNARLVILLFPFKEQVYWDAASRCQPEGQALTRRQVDAPLEAVKATCARLGVECCDLLPALRARAETGEQLYLRVSAHWNDAGNAAAAGAVAACLDGSGKGDTSLAGRATGTDANFEPIGELEREVNS